MNRTLTSIMRKRNEGFTLIELLVVIAIIGILSSVVLASLNTARQRGQDAKMKSEMSGLRAAAEISFDSVGNYSGVFSGTNPACTSADSNISQYLTSIAGASADADCYDSNSGYVMSAQLPSGGATNYWCVDSWGRSQARTSAVSSVGTGC